MTVLQPRQTMSKTVASRKYYVWRNPHRCWHRLNLHERMRFSIYSLTMKYTLSVRSGIQTVSISPGVTAGALSGKGLSVIHSKVMWIWTTIFDAWSLVSLWKQDFKCETTSVDNDYLFCLVNSANKVVPLVIYDLESSFSKLLVIPFPRF